MGGKSSRDKGARGERAVASILRRCFPDARRGRQYDSARECDIEGTPFRLEVKLRKKMLYRTVEDALAQCFADGRAHDDDRPVVGIFKRDNGPFVAAMTLDTLVRVVESMFYKFDKEQLAEVVELFGEEDTYDDGA